MGDENCFVWGYVTDEILCARTRGTIFSRPRAIIACVPGAEFCPEEAPDTLASVDASGPFSPHIRTYSLHTICRTKYIRSQIQADQGQ